MMSVAAAAGVSQATVSLVLSGSKGARLTDETRRRVLQAAQDLGYKFVRRGSRVDQDGQGTIVFVADEIITDPWMSLAFEGARDRALEVGINVLMGVSHADADVETNILAGFDKCRYWAWSMAPSSLGWCRFLRRWPVGGWFY